MQGPEPPLRGIYARCVDTWLRIKFDSPQDAALWMQSQPEGSVPNMDLFVGDPPPEELLQAIVDDSGVRGTLSSVRMNMIEEDEAAYRRVVGSQGLMVLVRVDLLLQAHDLLHKSP